MGVGTPYLSSPGAHGGFGEARSLSEVGRGIAARLPLEPLTLLFRPQDSPFFQQYELDLREPMYIIFYILYRTIGFSDLSFEYKN